METAEGLPSLRKTTNRVRSEERESLGERERGLSSYTENQKDYC